MATGIDELPLLREENETVDNEEWEQLSSLIIEEKSRQKANDYAMLEEEEEEDIEMGMKGVADVDYVPEHDSHIELQKGDIVVIHGQTIDGVYYNVVNLRTNQEGEVPCQTITLENSESFGYVPSKSNLQRGNVIKRKRNKNSRDMTRRTGSDFTSSFPLPDTDSQVLEQLMDPGTTSLKEVTSTNATPPDDERLVKSESYTQSLPVQYRRIEKFRVLSISGADRMGRPTIVFSACRLPPSYQISHDTLFEYLKYTLDQYVESDYTLVYFHYGLNSNNKPSYGWLYQIYKELDRKYKKNLKRLYIVHPTTFVKFMMGLFRPIISYKFGKKLVYINRLAELDTVLFTDQMDIPKEVFNYDKTLRVPPRESLATETRSSFYVPINEPLPGRGLEETRIPTQQFGVSISVLKERTGNDIPIVIRKCIEYLTEDGLTMLGIFRRTPSQYAVQEVKKKFDSGEDVVFQEYGDPHLAATTLKMFLRELPEPLLCFDTNSKISQLKFVPEENRVKKCREIVTSLPELNYTVLKYLMSFISKVVENEGVNKMSSTNLSIVFGPNLLWSKNEIASLNSMSEINRFTLLLIEHCMEVFTAQ